MAGLVGKAVDLVFHTWAVTRPHTVNLAGEHGASVKARANNLVRTLIGVCYPTRPLVGVHISATHETEDRHQWRLTAEHAVTRLFAAFRKIDAAPIDAGRGTGLQAALRQAQLFQASRQSASRRVTRSTRRIVIQAHMDFSIQKRTRRENHSLCAKAYAHLRNSAHNP